MSSESLYVLFMEETGINLIKPHYKGLNLRYIKRHHIADMRREFRWGGLRPYSYKKLSVETRNEYVSKAREIALDYIKKLNEDTSASVE